MKMIINLQYSRVGNIELFVIDTKQ